MRLAVIAKEKNDFGSLLESISGVQTDWIFPDDLSDVSLSDYESLVILGGTQAAPLILPARLRAKIEKKIDEGAKVFAEFVGSIDDIYTPADAASTRFWRLVSNTSVGYIKPGDLLEDQCNSHAKAYFSKKSCQPLLYYKAFAPAHDRIEVSEADVPGLDYWALWLERPNLMICTFRMCNFVKARFSPLDRWRALVTMICEWITGKTLNVLSFGSGYRLEKPSDAPFENRLRACFDKGMKWFERSGMLVNRGVSGIKEGVMTEISPDGTQRIAQTVRADCTGEASMAFLADYLLNGNATSLEISDALEDFCFDCLQIKGGRYDGMLRWSEVAWNVCYQDDNARVLIPALLKMMYTGDRRRLDDCCRALEFLVKTTGTDGLRVARTDNLVLDDAEMDRLKTTEGAFPSAHYNAFYHAALLMCGQIAGRRDFIDVGVRGLEAIMSKYPDTTREQSETEELCRLVFPLSWLFRATGEEKHREYLYRVVNDLQRLKHKNGGYMEWDTGYKAACSRKENGECSLLAENGDPVADLLYSVNWLPLGFLHAFLATGDGFFKTLWREMAEFFISSQLNSENELIDGAWARGFDLDKFEVYGIPNDVGWGPWAIESGWTVSEILAGLGFGLLPSGTELHI